MRPYRTIHLDAPAAMPRPGAVVVPRQVYASGRDRFDVLVRFVTTQGEAMAAIFAALPLYEHGWRRQSTNVRRLHRDVSGIVYRIERAA